MIRGTTLPGGKPRDRRIPAGQQLRHYRASLAVGLLVVIGGSLTFAHATVRARTAERDAERYAHQVHAATRVFIDWLQPAAVDVQLDAMALRRMRLLERARFERLRSISVLVGLLGLIQILLTYLAAAVRRELSPVVDPDEALLPTWDPTREDDLRAPRRRARPLPYREARTVSLKGI
jgi:hypothetical protein